MASPPVLVRNCQVGPTVFTDTSTNLSVEWQGAGDPDGEDIQQVPSALVTDNVAFIRALSRGVLAVEAATPEILDQVNNSATAWRARQDAVAKSAMATLDQVADNDLLMLTCVGPPTRGTGTCDQPTAVRSKTKDDKPPLCDRHKNLATQYVLTETDEIRDGEAVKKWIRMSVGASLPDGRD